MIIEDKVPKNHSKEYWTNRIENFFNEQTEKWEFLKNNYEKLSNVNIRIFEFVANNFKEKINVIVQYNPLRVKSTVADVSESAIQNRTCFLCENNLPDEQNGLVYNNNYIILINPYPILENHLTIPKRKHSPQTIINHFHDMLNLTEDLSGNYSIIYNGPKCGASAPDHMHFQAIKKNILPIENDYESIKENIFIKSGNLEIYIFENYLRRFISFESVNKGDILYAFKILFNALKKISTPKEEPMINLISSYVLL